MKRMLVIYNPRSSQYCHVKKEVLDVLKRDGQGFTGYEIEKTSFEKNVEKLSRTLKDGDYVVAVGGDATAAITLNAIIKSSKDAVLAVLPYGNFNDLARTLKTERNLKYFKVSDDTKIKTLYPLAIYVDNELWRYASCYVTMGMTAEAVEIFDEAKIRAELQKGRKSSWRSYIHLMDWYFKNRKKKIFVPDFKMKGRLYHHISDYAAVNGRSMARVMKGGDDYLKPKVFRREADDLAKFWRLFKLMAKSLTVRTPGEITYGDTLEFVEPATVEMQAEGEYRVFCDVKKIEVVKDGAKIKVVQN